MSVCVRVCVYTISAKSHKTKIIPSVFHKMTERKKIILYPEDDHFLLYNLFFLICITLSLVCYFIYTHTKIQIDDPLLIYRIHLIYLFITKLDLSCGGAAYVVDACAAIARAISCALFNDLNFMIKKQIACIFFST